MLAFSIIFGLLSIIILYAEFVNMFGAEYNIIYNIITDSTLNDTQSYFVSHVYLINFNNLTYQIACLIPLMYLVYATNYGLFEMKVTNGYALHRNHRTDPSCLLFSSMHIMRLSIPIAYNFLELTKLKSTALFNVMGSIEYVKFLGEDFNKYVFPSCLILMVLMTVFNVYGKIMKCIGMRHYSFGSEYH